ncbi:MAG: glutaredoxin family protein [Anaerolineae bacterium]|nr:glutaredoxin family protein [Anaerolineae bacterium]
MAEPKGHVSGARAEHEVLLYALSTCIWCRKTRQFLEDQGVTFDFVYVDLLDGDEKTVTIEKVREWNPAKSFPTLVVDDQECIVGYKPDKIKECLNL